MVVLSTSPYSIHERALQVYSRRHQSPRLLTQRAQKPHQALQQGPIAPQPVAVAVSPSFPRAEKMKENSKEKEKKRTRITKTKQKKTKSKNKTNAFSPPTTRSKRYSTSSRNARRVRPDRTRLMILRFASPPPSSLSPAPCGSLLVASSSC